MERQLRAVAAAVLFGGLALTLFIVAALFNVVSERDRAAFEANARNVLAAVAERVETSIALLRGVAGLMASQDAIVTVESYRAYMDRVGLREQYPGILGIGFSRRIVPADRELIEQRMQGQGHAGFRVWPEHPRDEWHSIVFLEPLDERNQAAVGYDMFTDPVRREAMERARDTGMAAASGIVELVQEIDEVKQPGFLIYLPVYRGGEVPPTLEGRRDNLRGFSYAPIRAVDFLSSAFPVGLPTLSFEVYHGAEADIASMLYAWEAQRRAPLPRFEDQLTVDVAGAPWTFIFRSNHSMLQAWTLPLVAGLVGLVLSALLAMLFWREANARRRIHAALEREQAARAQAERANRMKDQFLATLSHELRTPLTAIVGWAEVLRRKGLSEQQIQTGLDTVERNARTQARLIDDLLDMNRISSGKLSMHMEQVEVAAVLDDVLAAMDGLVREKGLYVEKRLPEEQLLVNADPARLQQVFWNILSNAVKFTPAGGRIDIAMECRHGKVRISFRDSGEGIEPSLLDHIFDPFAQADGTITRRHGGLGLGLAIARDLVVLHAGSISAHSEGLGRGACFVVELPRLESPSERSPASEARDQDEPLRGSRILLVDDEPDARHLVRMFLEQRGAYVQTAGSASEALDALAEYRPDVLVSDIGMPGMNGYELMRAIRRLAPDKGGTVPAIALTAYAREEDRDEALRAGYQVYVVKPVRPDKLVQAIAQLLKMESGQHLRRATGA